MANVALRRLTRLQKKLHEATVPQARNLASGSNPDVNLYSMRFEAGLPDSYQVTSLKTLSGTLAGSRVAIFGDFHTHNQSQKEFIRVIDHMLRKVRIKPVIALECFRREDQPWLEKFLLGGIDEEGLLARTGYGHFWGFPWDNYRPILEFAKKNGLKVHGINSRRAGRDSLQYRDRFMARALADIRAQYARAQVFCLVGEFHLADDNLPRHLTGPMHAGLVRVVINVDRYYEAQQDQLNLHRTRYLRLAKNIFCIMNAAPWLKWQSFTIWQETRDGIPQQLSPAAKAGEEIYEADLEYDIDSHFFALIKIIDGYLGLKRSESELTDFHIYFARGGQIQESALAANFKRRNLRKAIAGLRFKDHFWSPDEKSLLLGRIDTNVLAEAAGYLLHTLLSGGPLPSGVDHALVFYREVIATSFAVLCSKIVNPQRKFTGIDDTLRPAKPSQDSRHREDQVDRFARSHLSWLARRHAAGRRSYSRPLAWLYQANNELNGAISYRLGQYWGNFLYERHLRDDLPISALRRIFSTAPASVEETWAVYLEISGYFFDTAASSPRKKAS